MAIINHTYFIGAINIPNSDRVDVQESLEWFIEKHEPEMLRILLGYELYKALTVGLATSPLPDRLKAIVEGKEYTDVYGNLQKWEGLKRGVQYTQLQSPIADYVYYFFQRDNASQTTAVGEAAAKTENAVRVSPVNKMVQAWNSAAKGASELIAFLEANKGDYPEWGSLTAQKALRYFQPINAFGI